MTSNLQWKQTSACFACVEIVAHVNAHLHSNVHLGPRDLAGCISGEHIGLFYCSQRLANVYRGYLCNQLIMTMIESVTVLMYFYCSFYLNDCNQDLLK